MYKDLNYEKNDVEVLKKNFNSALKPLIPELFPTENFLNKLVNRFIQEMVEEKNENYLEVSGNYDSSSFTQQRILLMLFSNFSYSIISVEAMQNHIKDIYIKAIKSDNYFYSRFIDSNSTDIDKKRVNISEVEKIIKEIEIPMLDIEMLKTYLIISGYDILEDVFKTMKIVNQTYFMRTGKLIIPPISNPDIDRANYLNENFRGLNHEEILESFYLNRYYSFCFED